MKPTSEQLVSKQAGNQPRDFGCEVDDYPELLSAAQMQAVDQRAIDQGLDSFALMNAAALGVVEHVIEVLEREFTDKKIGDVQLVVLAGPGNNGGDGLIAASVLRDKGYAVSLLHFGFLSPEQSDAGRAYSLWKAPTLSLEDGHQLHDDLIMDATIIVDALFGAGLSRALDPTTAALVHRVNESNAWVVAVDVPSGLDGNRNQSLGACIQANSTVTFCRFKPVHVLYPGRALCADKTLVQIGLDERQFNRDAPICCLNVPAVFKHALPSFDATSHKFHRGHVVVRGGPVHSTGAARLSATTAIYSGAGLVSLACDSAALVVNASHLTAVMLARCDTVSEWKELLADSRINTVVVGPGNGLNDATRDAVRTVLELGRSCVLDADALSCWQELPDEALSLMAASDSQLVLTPHAGEFQRLFGHTEAVEQPSKLHQARAAARLCGSTVILKGADTVIASKDGRACINANAPAWLATAGAGDVLAGLVAALMAQGMPAFEASCAGVWLHGAAAATLGYPMCAEQLVTQVGRELAVVIADS